MDVEFSEILICVGLVIVVIGLLSLVTLGSMIFTFCSYTGVISLLTGFLEKLGLIPERVKSKNGVISILLFASGLFFVTGVNMLFVDVKAHAQLTRFAFTNAEKLCLTFIRPYAYLFQPLMEAGVAALITALAAMYLE